MSNHTLTSVIDPVCGMSIDPQSAAAVVIRNGSAVHFCSIGCKEQFDASPESSAAPMEEETTSCCGGGSCAM